MAEVETHSNDGAHRIMPQTDTNNRKNITNLRTPRRRNSDRSSQCCLSSIPILSKFVVVILVVSSLMLDIQASVASTSTSTSTPTSTSTSLAENNSNGIKIVFSDLDGTLIHYPKKEEDAKETSGKLLEFPKSSTGKVGVISAKTLSLVDEIRNQNKVKFVLISGMRTSTLLQRLPYLPRADAYCSENGGRIFYPVEAGAEKEDDKTKRIINTIDGDGDVDDIFWVHPQRYRHEGRMEKGGDPHRNRPFGIREDKAWRKKMIASLGSDSFGSFSLQETFDDPGLSSMPLSERDGLLWDFARDLIHTHGFVLDTKGYSACFRVNKKQQTSEALAEMSPSKISALLNNSPWKDDSSIASSVNLSCVDFYPSCSGKKNCCLYLASKFFPKECQPKLQETNESDVVATTNEDGMCDDNDNDVIVETEGEGSDSNANVSTAEEEFLSNHAVCMCDDDNDLEMALACQHAYLPDIASESMRETITKFPNQFTTTFSGDTDWDSEEKAEEELRDSIVVEETDASDEALTIIWTRTYKEPSKAPVKRSRLSPKNLSLALCCVAIFVVLK